MNERPSRSSVDALVSETLPGIRTVTLTLVLFVLSFAAGNVVAGESVGQQIWTIWVLFPAVLVLSVPMFRSA
jgi:hypothetical protein